MAGKKGTGKTVKGNTKGKKQTKKKQTKSSEDIFKSSLFIHCSVWVLMFVFTALFMYMGSDALLASAVRELLGGLFGTSAYMIPIVFAGTLIYMLYYKDVARMWYKFTLSIAELTRVSSLIGIFAPYDISKAFENGSVYINGGGLIGVAIGKSMAGAITKPGTFFILFILFVVTGCLIARFNIMPYLISGTKRFFGFSSDMGHRMKERTDEYIRQQRERREAEEEYDDDEYGYDEGAPENSMFTPVKDFMPDDELPESLSERSRKKSGDTVYDIPIKKTGVSHTMDILNEFAAELEENGLKEKADILEDELADDDKFDLYNMSFDEQETEEDNAVDTAKTEPAAEEEEENLLEGMQVNEMKETKPREKNLTDGEKLSFRQELETAMFHEIEQYRFPTLDLLDEAKHVENDKRRELYNKAEQLIAVLDNFGVKAKPVQVTQGPTVTRYEIQPSSGTKLSKIVGLADDIALNLAVSTVLIAPVPGKAATVGVEIPNTNVTPVTIREMLSSAEFRNAKSKLTVCLGKDIGGNVVVGDIAKWPHALIAGATGSGKSVCINTIVASILYKADPNEVKLIMVDPKQVELGVYNGIPHLLIPVVTEAKKAAGALNWAVSEMMQRYELFKNSGVRKLEMYNKLMEKTGGEKLPQIVIIIDELADLMMVAAKEIEDYICRLAQLARAAGIHLIIATQRPSVDVITGLIKANIPSRIAFLVSSQVDSRTILDKAGAEKLLGMGDMLYYPTGARSTARVQGAFVSDDEVERIVDYIKETSPETHYREDLEEHIERISLGENGVTPDKDDDGDSLLPEAIKLAVELGKISTSMIQRRLGVGYSRAGRIIDQMEARGIVSPANGAKPRDVLVSHADMDFYGNSDSEEFEDE